MEITNSKFKSTFISCTAHLDGSAFDGSQPHPKTKTSFHFSLILLP